MEQLDKDQRRLKYLREHPEPPPPKKNRTREHIYSIYEWRQKVASSPEIKKLHDKLEDELRTVALNKSLEQST